MTEVPTVPPPPPPGMAPPPPPPPAPQQAAPVAQAPAPTPAAPAPVIAAAPVADAPQQQAQDISDATLLIPTSLIDLMQGQQHRITRDPQKLNELTASIKANGQNDPVKVMKNGSRYMLVYGHGRLQAITSLGIDKIRAELFYGNQQEAALLALSENVNREELNPIEIAFGIREAIKRGSSLQEVAIKLGKLTENGSPNVVWVEQHLELLNLNNKQREEVANNMMSKTVASRLAKMASDNREAVFTEMEKKVSEGEKKPTKAKQAKADKAVAAGAAPPPPPPKKTAAALEAAKATVSGKQRDKFIGTKAARELYNEIKKIEKEYVPTVEDDVVKEMLKLIDYLLGKRKGKPLQLDVE